MEEEQTKLCTNCKREIPAVNFTTHSVHCARNIRSCPVCKEPVPAAQLQEHHDALHKEVPCKKCGESVCGTDLEDHIRDSCAQTIKPCRFCELELPRHSLPAHESYCGARSEQCPDCREYVMAKYRQLHLDSNHGFIRLDDDPTPKEEKPKPRLVPKLIPKSVSKPVTNGFPAPSTSNGITNARPVTEVRHYEAQGSNAITNNPRPVAETRQYDAQGPEMDRTNNLPSVSANDMRNYEAQRSREAEREGRKKVTAKRTNDQPQINTSVHPAEKVTKEMLSRGAVKKRPAPPPPLAARDHAYWSAAARAQREERERQLQTAHNRAVGLPPVLSPAAKLDKLRKMDALHNRETEDVDYRSRLQGRVWMPPDVPVGNTLGSADAGDFSHLQPMTAAQFMNRVQELNLGSERRRTAPAGERPRAAPGAGAAGDRFSDIKSSLRELRRGLNEVTAPYNTSNATNNTHIDSNRLAPPSPPAGAGADDDDELRLPCEFCGEPVPADDLVLHQTGCRPDLAQRRPRARRQPRPRAPSPLPPPPLLPEPRSEPVIPCEFCPQALPVYLISEHQERCQREANFLFSD